eukprot:363747-Chlamydomonas_euryale.AAC.9
MSMRRVNTCTPKLGPLPASLPLPLCRPLKHSRMMGDKAFECADSSTQECPHRVGERSRYRCVSCLKSVLTMLEKCAYHA